MTGNHLKIAVIGFGEAARAFASGWARPDGAVIASFDLKMKDAEQARDVVAAAAALDVEAAGSHADAVRGAQMIFSLVTADRALEASGQAADGIEPGAFYFDCNSCSPQTKRAAADIISAAGGRYVDVAVMAPVQPKRHETPLLVSGEAAVESINVLENLGMRPAAAGARVGDASSIKMLRSVMIKGLEALTAEAMLAARRAGVETAVIASLQASDPGIDWERRCAYNLERMMVHGERRAAEMREVAATLRELALPDRMSTAIVDWQAEIASLHLEGGEASLAGRVDRILDGLSATPPERP